MLAYPASSGSFPKISCFALRGCRHARSHIGAISRAWEVDLPTSRSLHNQPSASVVPKVTDRQGGIAIELIDDGNPTIDITANIAANYIGR
ncbi:hypothetical protein IG631_24205 [Alternaria alternata]|nr:hypothetical protein IG631_24205 [Alternaria alternata]